jgi:hypothetical protein
MRARISVEVSAAKSESVVGGMARVVKTEGIKGIYKGLGTSLVRVFPYVGGKYVAYDQILSLLPVQPDGKHAGQVRKRCGWGKKASRLRTWRGCLSLCLGA